MTPMLTTSLHLEIARLRHENERLRAQWDALLSEAAESCSTGGEAGTSSTVVRGFVDQVDWDCLAERLGEPLLRADHEIGATVEGTKVFRSINALKQQTENTERGIVEVEMRLVRVVEPGTI